MTTGRTIEEYRLIEDLRHEGPVGGMIADALSAQDMIADDLIGTLMSEPYSLAPTEENLQEITRIINTRKPKITLKREPGCFRVSPVLSLS